MIFGCIPRHHKSRNRHLELDISDHRQSRWSLIYFSFVLEQHDVVVLERRNRHGDAIPAFGYSQLFTVTQQTCGFVRFERYDAYPDVVNGNGGVQGIIELSRMIINKPTHSNVPSRMDSRTSKLPFTTGEQCPLVQLSIIIGSPA